jgi:hypothetical protein
MSSEYITFPSEDDKVKVNSITKARALRFIGSGESVVDNPDTNTIDITIPGGAILNGVALLQGDASTKVFTIAHNSPTTPTTAFVQPKSSDALGNFIVSVDATNITITYSFAPPSSGSSNVVLSWMVVK